MRFKQFTFAFSFLLEVGVLLSCGGANVPPRSTNPSGEILYILNNGTITTYSIDTNSLAATPLEQPVTLVPASVSLLQFDPSPDDHFVYAVWSDGQNQQHLSVFQTDSSGVPQVPAIQILNADSLSQFNMHPSGRFAYMLEVTSSNNQYQAEIRLFDVQHTKGTLKENPQVQGSYGPAPFWPAFLYGFSPDGSKLYDTSTLATGSLYRQRAINLNTGVLGGDRKLLSVSGETEVVIGNVIIDQYRSDTNTSQSYLDIFPNTLSPSQAVIHCTITTMTFCATATNVQLDSSGHYLFFTDPATQAVHVVAIDLSKKKISDTGSSMPMTSQTPGFAFSPDGSIVYALLASDGSVHFYHFDRAGSLSQAGTPLALAPGSGICPAEHQVN
jgi:6-phosphogluconolactonase (cycloisomerase 2 family)